MKAYLTAFYNSGVGKSVLIGLYRLLMNQRTHCFQIRICVYKYLKHFTDKVTVALQAGSQKLIEGRKFYVMSTSQNMKT